MEFTPDQIDELRKVFSEIDVDNNGVLDEPELRKLLLEFEIDESFAPPMLRILRKNHEDGVRFDDLINFFKILMSGDTKKFFKLLFSAIDGDNDQTLGLEDITSFAELVGDKLTEEEVKEIMTQCDYNGDGKVNFSDFWKWYKQQHGISSEEDESEEDNSSELAT